MRVSTQSEQTVAVSAHAPAIDLHLLHQSDNAEFYHSYFNFPHHMHLKCKNEQDSIVKQELSPFLILMYWEALNFTKYCLYK